MSAALRTRLAEIDTSIVELRSRLKTVEDDRRSIQQQLDDITYPILTLPAEITSEIFLQCLPGNESVFHRTLWKPYPAPISLLHICREWRFIAIATPRLWTFLQLNLPDLPDRFLKTERYKEFLSEWLARVCGRPLSLELATLDYFPNPGEPARLLVTHTLHSLASHIRTLHLSIYPDHYPPIPLDFPLLRELLLGYTTDSEEEFNVENSIQTFSAAPQLRDIYMFCKAAPSFFAMPWHQLTVFKGEEVSSRECATVLGLAPSLVQCTFDEPYSTPDTPFTTHMGLKSFELCETGDVLFRFLALPALQTLQIVLYDSDDGDEHVLPFISRSSRSLLKFSAPASSRVPVRCLLDMVLLTYLVLDTPETEYLTELVGLLDRANTWDSLPELQVLELSHCAPYINEPLITALSSRAVAQEGRARLRSFRQTWLSKDRSQRTYRVDPAGYIGIALKKLADDGMEIHLGYSSL
ncbi:hypothetical protein B0H16DRAFT_1491532 [Mycena metata]|uniref:F-box domain-containing protein n=1 Tax=Mycena metata TaxID=1033252 RepID=A0AAD7KF04_9AGAR|nr:hypothetical protein B0H16DRAFT_1491532 [Mycena metata]